MNEQKLYPTHVGLETVRGCNARCPACPISHTPYGATLLPDAIYTKIIDEIAVWPKHNEPNIILSGIGEPLVDRKFVERVQYAHSKGLRKLGTSTNGALLFQDKAEALLRAGLSSIIISLDAATDATHAKLRTGLDFGQTVSNVESFIRTRNSMGSETVIELLFVVHEDNEAEYEEFVAFWLSKLLEQDRIRMVQRHNFGKYDFSGIAPTNQLCEHPFAQIQVWADGIVPTCCVDMENENILGDVTKNALLEIFNGPRFSTMRAFHASGRRKNLQLCGTCNVPECGTRLLQREGDHAVISGSWFGRSFEDPKAVRIGGKIKRPLGSDLWSLARNFETAYQQAKAENTTLVDALGQTQLPAEQSGSHGVPFRHRDP